MLAGCASQKPDNESPLPFAPVYYERSTAGALAFDPPVIANEPPLQLSRDFRTPGAFVGYESLTTTYYYLRIDDRQTDDFGDRYERRAFSEKFGVTYR
jgi:hypothetical protein